jgi:shikimate kinase
VTAAVQSGAWTGVDETQARQSHGAAQRRLSARSVALIGFMGVGKTSVGRELARLLDRPFADTDTMVQQRAGASIPELFARGEAGFRALERAALLEALDPPGRVLALGGGAFIQPGCPELLLPRALVVHLYTPWRVMLDLLPALAADRPLIGRRPVHETQQLFLSRAAAYRRAHLRVCLPRHSPLHAAQEIVTVLRQHGREE